MGIFDFFRRKKTSAEVAKDRLQIVVARERSGSRQPHPDYLAELQRELLAVVAKYETVDLDQVTVRVDNREDVEVLELNIVLPESSRERGQVKRSTTVVYA